MMDAVHALMWNGKTYIKIYREEGLRLESINPAYDDLFAPYEDEPKIVGIVVGHSYLWRFRHAFDYHVSLGLIFLWI